MAEVEKNKTASGLWVGGGRAEIDTSPPFESVKEAVTRFGGSGFWIPLHLLRDPHLGLEQFDIEKVEEQTAELERRLTAKEKETLDVLREVETTKRILQELKLKLHGEASGGGGLPALASNAETAGLGNLIEKAEETINLCPAPPSSDLILTELKLAKLNLSKTTNDLSEIRTSVETLNKKAEIQKSAIEMNRERQATSTGLSEPAKVSVEITSSSEPVKDSPKPNIISRELEQLNFEAEQFIQMAEAAKSELSRAMSGYDHTNTSMRTAEMRWFAAKKMEEAARAVEAVALEEMNCFRRSYRNSSIPQLPKPERPFAALHDRCFPTVDSQKVGNQSRKNILDAMFQIDEAIISKFAIMKKLEEATQEVKLSKQALEEVFDRVEVANRQILETGEAVRKWGPERGYKMHPVCSPATTKYTIPNPSQYSAYHNEIHSSPNHGNAETKHVIRPTRSVGELLSRKQIIPEEDCMTFGQTDTLRSNGTKVSLSQMLNRQRTVPSSPSRTETTSTSDGQRQHIFTKNRKFGFIHLSIPLTRLSNKSNPSKPR